MEKTINLTNGASCIVDAEDFAFLSRYDWHFASGYAAADICGRRMQMHRLLTNCPVGKEVDHINRIKLDNRKHNLRVCTHSQNGQNRAALAATAAGYKGVTYDSRDGTYTAAITINKKRFILLYTKDPIEAAKAYDAAARFHFGDFATTNFAGIDKKSAQSMRPRVRNVSGKTSAYRGVRKTTNGRWQALCCKKHCGVFDTQEEAARAYDSAAKRLLVERAILNFPEDVQRSAS